MTPDFVKNRVTQLLVQKNLSEYRVSVDLGHSKGYIQKITSGKALPSLEALLEICDYFDITLSEFFHNPEDFPSGIHRKPVRELMEQAVKLKDSDIELLITLCRDFKA